MVTEVLPDVPYLQIVFTIPKMLRKHFLFERALYGELAKVAYAGTREFFAAHFSTNKKADPGHDRWNPEDENQDPPGDARNDLIVGFVC